MKEVTTFNTRGQQRTIVKTNANTWGELQTDLTRAGVEYSGMKATIGETQVSLSSSAAQLPDYNFTLFLSPRRSKAGK